MTKIYVTLDEVINETGYTAYKINQIAKIRPNTFTDLTKNKDSVKSIKFETFEKILDAINELQKQNNKEKRYTIADLLKSE